MPALAGLAIECFDARLGDESMADVPDAHCTHAGGAFIQVRELMCRSTRTSHTALVGMSTDLLSRIE